MSIMMQLAPPFNCVCSDFFKNFTFGVAFTSFKFTFLIVLILIWLDKFFHGYAETGTAQLLSWTSPKSHLASRWGLSNS